jgi:hypothetical protein
MLARGVMRFVSKIEKEWIVDLQQRFKSVDENKLLNKSI